MLRPRLLFGREEKTWQVRGEPWGETTSVDETWRETTSSVDVLLKRRGERACDRAKLG
jgi:hypothetical protein